MPGFMSRRARTVAAPAGPLLPWSAVDVVSTSGFPAAGFEWTLGGSQVFATFVVKGTFALASLKSELASKQEPLHLDTDVASATLHDGAPFKRRAEVLLVGSAFATLGPVTTLLARLVVGEIDKSITIVADRHIDADGQLSAGTPFARMPLTWDRAARGPSGDNPLGLGGGGGPKRKLPNLVVPGSDARRDGTELDPAGFGPIPDSFPIRRARANGVFRGEDGRLSLSPNVDPDCFQSAPRDQWQKSAFDAETRVVLENLHPKHPRLVTNLVPLWVAVELESQLGRREIKAMTADTLVIDTDRAICAMTYRCSVPITPGERLRASVRTAASRQDLEAPVARNRPAIPSAILIEDERSHVDVPRAEVERLDTKELSIVPPTGRARLEHEGTQETVAVHLTALPFGHSPERRPPPAAPPPPIHTAPTVLSPSSVMTPPVMVSPPTVMTPPVVVSPPGVMSPPTVMTPSTVMAPSSIVGAAASMPAHMLPQRPIEAPSALLAIRPELRSDSKPAARLGSIAIGNRAPESAMSASDHAADASAKTASKGRFDARPFDGAAPETSPRRDEQLELLYSDSRVSTDLRTQETFRAVLTSPKYRRGALEHGAQDAAEDARLAMRVLAEVSPTESFELDPVTLDSTERSGKPPMVVVSGELVLKFDEREALRATVGVATPFLPLDRALKEAADFATAVLESEWSGAFSIDNASARVRDALTKAARDVPKSTVEATVQRLLLERRKFRTVTVLGAERIRAELVTSEGRAAVPLYLPIELRDVLPLFERLPIRSIVEVRPRQDGAESSPHALFVRAVARRIGSRARS